MQHQKDAYTKLDTGKILVGGTGSGKSITALHYFAEKHPDKKIVIICTAKKRNTGEWFADAMKMSLRNEMVVDSWNNIKNYDDLEGCCFIFDEQKVLGNGAWVKSFHKIAKKNEWIVLSATPADTWMDLIPIFIANGFYTSRTDFTDQHVMWARFVKYPKVDRYLDDHILEKHRAAVYVEMPYQKKAIRVEHMIPVDFNREDELRLYRDRWNIYEDQPLKDVGEMMRLLRKNANLHPSRLEKIVEISAKHPRLIIFYTHDPELEVLRTLHTTLDIEVAEWNGHLHQDVPQGERWIYLVQYQAGGESWNCVTTDAIVFYGLPYSWKQLEQAKGRIDRLNTKFESLHYYILISRAIIDQGIWRGLGKKKNFQQAAFAKRAWPPPPPERTALN